MYIYGVSVHFRIFIYTYTPQDVARVTAHLEHVLHYSVTCNMIALRMTLLLHMPQDVARVIAALEHVLHQAKLPRLPVLALGASSGLTLSL